MTLDEAKAIVFAKWPNAVSEYMPSKGRWFLRKRTGGLCISGSGANGDEIHAWQNAAMRIKALNEAIADTPTPKAQEGEWTLTAPDGRQWKADSPLKCVSNEIRERVPPDVAMARINRELESGDQPHAGLDNPYGPYDA